MKTSLIFVSMLFSAWSLFAANEPGAVQLLQKAAELHGLTSPKSLVSFEMETVYSSVSGGIATPSRWFARVDFAKKLDLGVRYVYGESERGVLFQRRIEGDKGRFQYGIGLPQSYDLGPYFGGNVVLAVSGIALLAVRNELQDLKRLGTLKLGDFNLEQVQFTYRGGKGVAYFSTDGRYAGHLEVDLKDNLKIYEVVTAYQTIDGLLVPSRITLFNNSKTPGGYGKLLTFRANPTLAHSDFAMKPSTVDQRGLVTPFELGLVPAEPAEFAGLKVGPWRLGDAARNLGLAEGDEIVAVNGKEVRKSDFFELEPLFWNEKTLRLTLLKAGKRSEVKLVR